MPGKKGSRIAASQARAKANARKKGRPSAPDLAAARQAPPAPESEDVAEEAAVGIAQATANGVAAAPLTAAATPAQRRRVATRRERQAMNVVAAGSLKWELSLIGIITAISGVALAVLKLATDIGR